MKHMSKLIIGLAFFAVLIAAIVFICKLIAGFFGGVLNFILGFGVLVALLVIVLWMFAYASKH